jgi:ATP-dependent protease ClpP protease subunit
MTYKQIQNIPNRNIKPTCSDDDEDNEGVPKSMLYLPYFEAQRTSRKITAYLDENVKEPRYYRQLIQAMDSLSEDDIVEISVNSYGGYLDGAIALLNAMDNCEAQVHVKHEGMAASAASLIVLAAPSVFVSPNATLMIHSATFGSFGKQTDVLGHAAFVDQKVKMLMSKVYKDFLSSDEFAEVLMGRELWMHYDEIVARLEKRHALQEKAHKQEEKEIKQAMKELEQESKQTKPRNTRKKPSVVSEG